MMVQLGCPEPLIHPERGLAVGPCTPLKPTGWAALGSAGGILHVLSAWHVFQGLRHFLDPWRGLNFIQAPTTAPAQSSFLTWVHLGMFTHLYFFLSFLVFSIKFISWKRVFRIVCLRIVIASWIKPRWLSLLHNDLVVVFDEWQPYALCSIGTICRAHVKKGKWHLPFQCQL